MKFYPIIKTPREIKEIKNSDVKVEDVYGVQFPRKKEKEIKLDLLTLILFCIFLPFVMKILLMLVGVVLIKVIDISYHILETSINFLIGVVVVILVIEIIIESEKENKEIQEKYKRDLVNFNELENKLSNSPSIRVYQRKKFLNEYFKKSRGYFIRSSTTFLKGISENYFYSVLKK
jgi:hypothetical protein